METNDNQTPPAETTPATPGSETPKADPNQMTIPKEEYDKLVAARTERDTLKPQLDDMQNRWSDVEVLLKPDVDQQQARTSLRALLIKSGLTPEQADARVNGSGTTQKNSAPADQGGGNEDDMEPGDEKYAALEQAIQQQGAALTQQQRHIAQTEMARRQADLTENVGRAVDGREGLGKLIKYAESRAGEDSQPGRMRETILAEVQRETLDRLRQRRADETRRRGQEAWDDKWIAEEGLKAAEAIENKYRSVIGDPSNLGRSTETGSGTHVTLPEKPPAIAAEGSGVADVQESLVNFGSHLLAEIAVKDSQKDSLV